MIGYLRLLCILILTTSLFSQGQVVTPDSKTVQEIQSLLTEKRYSDGIVICAEALKIYSENLYIKYLCAKHYVYAPVKTVTESRQNFGLALTLLSDSAEKLGMNVKNRVVYRDALFHLGIIRQLTGYNKLAIGYYRKVVQYDPRYAAAWYNMAAIYEADGNFIEANRAWLSYLDSITQKTDDF